MPILAASIACIALTACFWGRNGRSAGLPGPSMARDDFAAAFSDDLPTAWVYARAARRSPETLYALLDRQSRQSRVPGSPLLAGTNVSPLGILHNTAP